ncbi:MAG: ribonuclease HII [Bdellovibrionota bacterium]
MAKETKFPDLKEEALLWKQGSAFVFGVDEAGRGCLAGPVCAAVSCWAPFTPAFGLPVPVRDSKVMTHAQREEAFEPVRRQSLAYGVGFATAKEIDKWNILRANHLAVARALEGALASLVARGLFDFRSLDESHFAFLSDGSHPLVGHCNFFVNSKEYTKEFALTGALFRKSIKEICIVKGDSKVFSIASASVLAKVSRDRHMEKLHEQYPAYEFASHKGYSTALHVEKLKKNGPCAEHRHSFAPVRESAELFS